MEKREKKAREEGAIEFLRSMGVEARRIPDEKLPKGRTRIAFFGEAKRIPKVGEKIEVRTSDGSWKRGYRAISGITTDGEYPGERVIWITPEQEWQAARKKVASLAELPGP